MNERHFFYTFLVAAEGLHWGIDYNVSEFVFPFFLEVEASFWG
jgi:hypothetical protein